MTTTRFSDHSPRALALLALAFAAACGSAANEPPEGAPQPRTRNGQMVPYGYDSTRANKVIENGRPDLPARAGTLVVANQDAGTATVLDAATLRTVATLAVGTGPHEVAVSPDGRWAVVTNYGSREAEGHTLSVIDLSLPTPAVVRTIELGSYHRPHGATFVKGTSTLLVTSESSQRLLLVDFASGRVDTALATNGRGSHMVAAQRDGRRAWTANIADGSVTEFDVDARRTGRTYAAAPADEGIAVTPGGVQVWVGSNSAHTVTVMDTEKGSSIATLEGFASPYRVGISRTGRVAVVSDPMNNKVWVFEVGSRKKLAEIDLSKEKLVKAGAAPQGITFDPIADIAYVTLHGTNQVAAIDLGTLKLVAVGDVGAGPDGVGFSVQVR